MDINKETKYFVIDFNFPEDLIYNVPVIVVLFFFFIVQFFFLFLLTNVGFLFLIFFQ